MMVASQGMLRRRYSPRQSKFGSTITRLRHERRAVALVEGEVLVLSAERVSENRGIPRQLPGMGSRVGVEQELVGVEATAGVRFVRAVHAKAVECRRPDVRQVAVEDFVGMLGKFKTAGLAPAVRIEQANLDPRSVRRENRKVRACFVRRRAKRVRFALADSHCAPPPRASADRFTRPRPLRS